MIFKRGLPVWACVAGAATLAWSQEGALKELQERTLSHAERLRQAQEQVFRLYGAELGYKSAEEIPIMDRRYEELDREVKRLERLIRQERDAALRAKHEADLRAAEAARESRGRELARQKAEAEAKRLAEIEAPLREALALFRQKQYQPAYDRFIKLYFERKESVPVAFYTGRSAFETQRYEIAAGAYQQVLAVEPEHQRAKLELARTYFVMGMPREAKVLFEEVGTNQELPPEVKKNINAYLDAIEDLQKRHHINGQLIAGLGFDSNVNQGNDYVVRGLENLGAGNAAKSDVVTTLVSFNSHRYDFGEPQGWQWQNSLLVFTNIHGQMSENNLLLMGLQTGPMVDTATGRIKVPLGYDKVWVDGEAYMNALSLSAAYERPLGKLHTAKAQFKWFDRSNDDSANSDRDATGYELSFDWQGLKADQSRLLNAGASWVSEAPKSGNRPDAEFTSFALRTGVTYFAKPWAFGGAFNLKQTDYPNKFSELGSDGGGGVIVTGLVKRSDTQVGINAFATRTLKENLTLNTQLGWLKNDSGYDPYTYDKITLQAHLAWAWGL